MSFITLHLSSSLRVSNVRWDRHLGSHDEPQGPWPTWQRPMTRTWPDPFSGERRPFGTTRRPSSWWTMLQDPHSWWAMQKGQVTSAYKLRLITFEYILVHLVTCLCGILGWDGAIFMAHLYTFERFRWHGFAISSPLRPQWMRSVRTASNGFCPGQTMWHVRWSERQKLWLFIVVDCGARMCTAYSENSLSQLILAVGHRHNLSQEYESRVNTVKAELEDRNFEVPLEVPRETSTWTYLILP